MTDETRPYKSDDLLNHQETERAGFLSQPNILIEKEPLSLLPRALSVTDETRPYKSDDLLSHQETERAGFLSQSNILGEEEPLSLLLRALSVTDETRPYKRWKIQFLFLSLHCQENYGMRRDSACDMLIGNRDRQLGDEVLLSLEQWFAIRVRMRQDCSRNAIRLKIPKTHA